MTDQLVVDWETLLDTLRRHGFSLYAIEHQIGISREQLRHYRNGATPRHTDGERVIAFWMQITSCTRDQLPMTKPPLSAAALR